MEDISRKDVSRCYGFLRDDLRKKRYGKSKTLSYNLAISMMRYSYHTRKTVLDIHSQESLLSFPYYVSCIIIL